MFRRMLSRLALTSLVVLMACDATTNSPGPKQVTVLGGTLQINAPAGYCIDAAASRELGGGAVVLIGRCTPAGLVAAALVTVTIGKPASGGVMLAGPQVLAGFLASEKGRRALSRDGVADHVLVVQSQTKGDALLLHLIDLAAGEYWRAITAIGGRLITISASGAAGVPLTPAEGKDLVQATLRLLHPTNPAAAG